MTRHRGRLGLAIAAVLAIGCASARPKPSDVLVWPSPPDPPRVKYLRTYRSPADLDPASLWERMRRAFIGTDASLAIFNPTTVALSPDETRLYVACTSTARVIEIDFAAGTMRLVADAEGHQPKQPFGLATDAEGNLYVADQIDHSVRVFSAAGGFLREVGRTVLERPIGIAIDRRRQILYVADGGRADDTHHQIEVFALDGRHLRTLGTRGFAPGQFNFPSYLAVSRDGTLYVGDSLNFRIQMFDPDGNLVGVFGAGGADVGTFNKIKGLAFDGAGLLHVADAASAWVQMFNAKHQLLLKYGDQGMTDGLMASPNGIAIDSKNNIYVADLAGNRVTQYVLVDTSGPEERAPAKAAPASPTPTAASPVR
ncbi:MAG TPA: SMP-30/gluconolactonase/LRE family protein [Anaeromyxobacter sp.]